MRKASRFTRWLLSVNWLSWETPSATPLRNSRARLGWDVEMTYCPSASVPCDFSPGPNGSSMLWAAFRFSGFATSNAVFGIMRTNRAASVLPLSC